MKIFVLHREHFKTSVWSGGTTTELYLYPEKGNYATRDFQLRISSATVDLEESDFTPLPGVTRFITPVDGTFTLTHGDGSTVDLSPLAVPYRFSGEMPTHCVGKATDFNLMLKGCCGTMEILQNSASIAPGFHSFYPTADMIFSVQNREFSLKKGELLVIFSKEFGTITFGPEPVLVCRADLHNFTE